MPDLLDRIRDELSERVHASREAVQEYERLQAALAALGEAGTDTRSEPSGGGTPRSRTTRVVKPRGRRSDTPRPRQRAPRGQNRENVLKAIEERPGVTALEVGAASGVKGPTLYTVLRRLVDEGTVVKRNLPGDDKRYALNDKSQTA